MGIIPRQLEVLEGEKTVKKETVYFFTGLDLLDPNKEELLPPSGRLILTKKHLCYLSIGRVKGTSWKKAILGGVAKGLTSGFLDNIAFDHASDLAGFVSGKMKQKKREHLAQVLDNEYSFLIPLERIAGYRHEKGGRFNPYKSLFYMDITNDDGSISHYTMLAFMPKKQKAVNHSKWVKALDKVMKNITVPPRRSALEGYSPKTVAASVSETPPTISSDAVAENIINSPKVETTSQDKNEHLHVLKQRLAKGEITKEEYFDLKKILES